MLQCTRLNNGCTRVTFRLPSHDPDGVVSVVGSFNDWRPGRHELVHRRDGSRSVSVTLRPGEYHFRYLATGDVWRDEPDAERHGHEDSVLRV